MFTKNLEGGINLALKLLVLLFCFTFSTNVYANSSNAMPAIIMYLLSSSSSTAEDENSLLTKTGQKVCFDYDTYAKVDCNETYKGQDGYYQKGILPNFTRDNNTNIVTDHNTNLQWQDDVSVKNLTTWSDTNTTCENLTLGGYDDWRVPNIDELETIVDYGRYWGDDKGSIGAINEVFKNTANTAWQEYWSSTAYLSYINYAWIVNFNEGYDYRYDTYSPSSVRCVREK